MEMVVFENEFHRAAVKENESEHGLSLSCNNVHHYKSLSTFFNTAAIHHGKDFSFRKFHTLWLTLFISQHNMKSQTLSSFDLSVCGLQTFDNSVLSETFTIQICRTHSYQAGCEGTH
jgi:hypothetical protein